MDDLSGLSKEEVDWLRDALYQQHDYEIDVAVHADPLLGAMAQEDSSIVEELKAAMRAETEEFLNKATAGGGS